MKYELPLVDRPVSPAIDDVTLDSSKLCRSLGRLWQYSALWNDGRSGPSMRSRGIEPEADPDHIGRAVSLAEASGAQHIKTGRIQEPGCGPLRRSLNTDLMLSLEIG